MPSDLGDAVAALMSDHDLLTLHTDEHLLVDQLVRHRVAGPAQRDHRLAGHHPGVAERRDVRVGRHRMQTGLFLGEHVDRGPTRLPILAAVDPIAEHGRFGP